MRFHLIKRHKFFWLAGLLTFFIGLATSAVWIVVKRSRVASAPPVVTERQLNNFCKSLNSRTLDVSGEIQVRGVLVGFHELVFYDSSCNEPSNAVWVIPSGVARSELVTSVDDLRDSAFREGNFWVVATLTGRLEYLKPESPAEISLESDIRVSPHYRFAIISIQNVDYISPNIPWPK